MSKEVKTREKVNMDPKYIIELTVKLFVTCLVVAGLLGGVNAITADKIAAINWEKTQKAMREVVLDKENSTFTEALELTDEMTEAAAVGGKLTELYGVQVGGETVGYAMKIVASGSQGNIEMMVGVDAEDAVTGVSVVKNSETAGIGSRVMENEPLKSTGIGVLDQFKGKSAADGELVATKNIEIIGGATVSTRGVTAGVNAALAVAAVLG
ncbi:MAG: FMN-binding protein [Ruminococcaceae bacterium]|nr:FMN-binding protein [Oscillospiraceae bacterium]